MLLIRLLNWYSFVLLCSLMVWLLYGGLGVAVVIFLLVLFYLFGY